MTDTVPDQMFYLNSSLTVLAFKWEQAP